jgi:hypothetical protein
MFISSDDEVSLGKDRAFQDPIVRFISENMEARLSLQDSGCFADGAYQFCDSLIRPFEFGSEFVGGFGKNGNGSE